MQNNKEKIIDILTSELSYCYCDNCKFADYDEDENNYCFGCYRKYVNWELSPNTAALLADKILKEVEKNEEKNKI